MSKAMHIKTLTKARDKNGNVYHCAVVSLGMDHEFKAVVNSKDEIDFAILRLKLTPYAIGEKLNRDLITYSHQTIPARQFNGEVKSIHGPTFFRDEEFAEWVKESNKK